MQIRKLNFYSSALTGFYSVAEICGYETLAKDDRGVRKCLLYLVEPYL